MSQQKLTEYEKRVLLMQAVGEALTAEAAKRTKPDDDDDDEKPDPLGVVKVPQVKRGTTVEWSDDLGHIKLHSDEVDLSALSELLLELLKKRRG
jgi:hypothetical protein